jgi:hypothetical protein
MSAQQVRLEERDYSLFSIPSTTLTLSPASFSAHSLGRQKNFFAVINHQDWELRLRPASQKIRIVEKKLNGNPHFMLMGSPQLAVREYTIHDVQRLEKNNNNDDEAADGLNTFRSSYEHSIVFFILSPMHQRDQLNRRDSFLHAAQQTGVRLLIVTDMSQAIAAITSIVQSLAPDKREKKRKYIAQIAEKNYLPSSMYVGGVEPTQEAIANHAKQAMAQWAARMEMQQGDINVALDMLGSIVNVVTASYGELDNIPITSSSKEMIGKFFGRETTCNDDQDDDGSDEFGGIGDSEFLNIPDPSPTTTGNEGHNMVYNQHETGYDDFGHQSQQVGRNGHSQASDFYTPINPSFARRRLDHHGDHHYNTHQYNYPSNVTMNNDGTGGMYTSWAPNNDHRYHGYYEDDNHGGYSHQYINQFM